MIGKVAFAAELLPLASVSATFLMNAAGILYLGRRTEALARWPHLLIVFVAALWVGGIASARLMPDDPAVGASGGLMGLLGFMLVFEGLHAKLVPHPARRRLLAGLVLMAIMGVLSACDTADFKYLLNETGLTKGNLSRHLQSSGLPPSPFSFSGP